MDRISCAIIGSGNIGTDLMIKVMRTVATPEDGRHGGHRPVVRRAGARGALGVAVTHEGIEGLRRLPRYADIALVFDATSAQAPTSATMPCCARTARR